MPASRIQDNSRSAAARCWSVRKIRVRCFDVSEIAASSSMRPTIRSPNIGLSDPANSGFISIASHRWLTEVARRYPLQPEIPEARTIPAVWRLRRRKCYCSGRATILTGGAHDHPKTSRAHRIGDGRLARIGAATVRELAEAGAAVAVNYRERGGEAAAVVRHIAGAGGRAVAIAADVSRADAVTAMVERVKRELGPVDILVNNAGIAITRGVDDLSEQDFDRTIAVNLKSVFLCTQAVLPDMRARQWGRIVNISSGAARGAGAIGPHYNASKAGIEGLTRGYAARLVKEGITINAVAPSLIETDMMKGQPQLASRIPLGRLGTADEVASAVMLLIDNPYMTGQTIAMSGGMAFN